MGSRKRLKIIGILIVIFIVMTVRQLIVADSETEAPSYSSDGDKGVENANQDKEGNEDIAVDDGLFELELIGYANAVGSFTAVSTDQLWSKINSGDTFFLFVGRPTCQWCRKVAPSLQDAFGKCKVDLYYLDSTATNTDESLASFREKFGIETVPALLKFEEGSPEILEIDLSSADTRSEIMTVVRAATESYE